MEGGGEVSEITLCPICGIKPATFGKSEDPWGEHDVLPCDPCSQVMKKKILPRKNNTPQTDGTVSDTPRTDKEEKFYFGDNRPSMEIECVKVVFAETLERENTALRAHAERLAEALEEAPKAAHKMGRKINDQIEAGLGHASKGYPFIHNDVREAVKAVTEPALTLYRAENPKV